ncbi:hypothetical protein DV711_01885 [Motiliproteus coralliicola]|uniref:Uncharacterized protein n=1 Tax=Motiliproteus coralliicola TaxID=2283196 RepID=A0A369WRR1_9GAMM|nr:transporter substrate-binding domain-containing protein [Motiliproteus coralliicola]RDE24362.1 hypothetical protein DV711_01885 [Motiliproteus coralliicola]
MKRIITQMRPLIVFCLLVPNLIAPVHAEQRQLRVGLFNMPPYYSQSSSGKPEGILIDILDEALADIGYQWQPHFMEVPEALKEVVSGNIDVLMIIRHPLVEGRVVYGQKPIMTMSLLAYHQRQTADVASLKDLRGKRVALLRGYGYGGLLSQLLAPSSALKIHIAEDHKDAFKLLESKQVDYVLDYLEPGKQIITEMGLQGIESNLLQKKEVYLVLSSKVADGKKLVSKLEKTMSETYLKLHALP